MDNDTLIGYATILYVSASESVKQHILEKDHDD
jgi:cytochrome c-type biogenesis protein CcmH/NrfG